MGIEDIKRWQWILIGLLVGLGMGWVQSGADPGNDGRLINQFDFERELTRSHPTTKEPLIKNVVIEPTTLDYRNKPVQPVTFLRLQEGAKTRKTYYTPAQFIANIPYRPTINAPSPLPADYKVADYLANVTKRNPTLRYQYGWWNERPAALTLWTVGAVVIIGGIWPTLLSLMTGQGLSPAREKKKKEDYFDRFSHAPEPEKAHTGSLVSEADRDRLAAMNDVLERELEGAGIATSTDTPAAAAAAAEVRKLEGGPLEVASATKNADDDDEIEVKGEFYPVLIHHKKHHDDDHEPKQH